MSIRQEFSEWTPWTTVVWFDGVQNVSIVKFFSSHKRSSKSM